MFGVGPTELLVIFVVALLVLGPKRLPELAHTLGKGLAEFRKATSDLTSEFDSARNVFEEESRKARTAAAEQRVARAAQAAEEQRMAQAKPAEPGGPAPSTSPSEAEAAAAAPAPEMTPASDKPA